RAAPFLEEIQQHPAPRIAIVSHGMIGKVMISMLVGHDEAQTLAMGQPNDVVFVVSLDGEQPSISHYVRGEGPFEGIYAT
ncbi:MAG TPA: phosphoglycerate mutase family protein, partial [Pseudomonadales bacterium]|nr:phosphoglycerate mutase family protein [Pseudomonadales bacterium]